jgi:FKBP-type peptidyl-prolyl isomerase-like protein
MPMKKRSGIKLLDERVGSGEEIQRHKRYRMTLRIWHSKEESVNWLKWIRPKNLLDGITFSEDGSIITADYKFDRNDLFAGLFYGIEGMQIGGKKTLKISPHLAYGEKGVEGIIPPNAVLKVEVEIISEKK